MPALPAYDVRSPKVALVHDFLVSMRGADRVFLAMCDIWPDADVFTTVYDPEGTEGHFARRRIETSFLQRLQPTARTFRSLLPLYPAAIQSFDTSDYDLVVSSSSGWAHAVPCGEETLHVSYCHNPFRYVWNERESTLANRDPVTRRALRALFERWRHWDRAAAQRVDSYITNSEITRQRIERYYGRQARVISPPVDTRRFSPGPVGDHYLVLSALMPHKRIDVTVQAFNALGLPLIVVGDGPDLARLQQLAEPNVAFAGRVSDERAAELLQSCRALVVAAIEEFGIAAVEAQAAGRPVIAAQAGGTLETVRDGETGCFWNGGPEELADAVRSFDDGAIDPLDCVDNAERFGLDAFQLALSAETDRAFRRFDSSGRRAPARETLRRKGLRRTTVIVPPQPWRANGTNGKTRHFERSDEAETRTLGAGRS